MSLDTHRALLESGREDQGEKKHLQPKVSHCCLNYANTLKNKLVMTLERTKTG